MNDVVTGLTKARSILIVPKAWTQHVYARNARKQPVSPHDIQASCWCLLGAIVLAVERARFEGTIAAWPIDVTYEIEKTLEIAADTVDITIWNDTVGRTKKEVIALLDEGIRIAKSL